jgi:hypothetical protein
MKPAPTKAERVIVRIVEAGPSPVEVDIRGVTNSSELLSAIERRFLFLKGTGSQLDLRLATLETWPRDTASIDFFFGLPTPSVRNTTPFPDDEIGLRRGALLFGRILPRDAGGAVDGFGIDAKIQETVKALADYFGPILRVFAIESNEGHVKMD